MTRLELNVCKLNVHRLVTAGVNGVFLDVKDSITHMTSSDMGSVFDFEAVTEEVSNRQLQEIMLNYLQELEDRLTDALDV